MVAPSTSLGATRRECVGLGRVGVRRSLATAIVSIMTTEMETKAESMDYNPRGCVVSTIPLSSTIKSLTKSIVADNLYVYVRNKRAIVLAVDNVSFARVNTCSLSTPFASRPVRRR